MSGKRRGSGDGGIRKRADGRWEGIVDLGFQNGRRKTHSVYGKTRAAVVKKLRDVQHKRDEGTLILDQRMTLGAWLDNWVAVTLENRVANDELRASTRDSYADTVRLHLKPGLGHHRLTKLTPTHVDDFIAAKRGQTHGKHGDKTYSQDSLRLMRATLRKALQDALAKGHVNLNVAGLSDPVKGCKRAEKYLTLDEARRLLTTVASDRLNALYVVALSLGLRRGEALGLRWEDIDLDKAQVTIRRSLKRVRNQPLSDGTYPNGRKTRLEFGTPKTASSWATLSLPSAAIEALRRHRIEQAAERLASPVWVDESLVFTTPAGAPIDPDNFWKQFSTACKAAGLGHRNPHQLRHSASTILLGEGIPLHEVCDILRHSSIAVTKDIYGHLEPERMRAGAEAIDAALRRTSVS
jgi:integrase